MRPPRVGNEEEDDDNDDDDDDESFVLASEVDAYETAVVEVRLNECRAASLAVREGLCSIVPSAVVSLLHWKELRALVAGREHINIDLLRACTEYDEDVSPDDDYIQCVCREATRETLVWFGLFVCVCVWVDACSFVYGDSNFFCIWFDADHLPVDFSGRPWKPSTTPNGHCSFALCGPGRVCQPRRRSSRKSSRFKQPVVLEPWQTRTSICPKLTRAFLVCLSRNTVVKRCWLKSLSMRWTTALKWTQISV